MWEGRENPAGLGCGPARTTRGSVRDVLEQAPAMAGRVGASQPSDPRFIARIPQPPHPVPVA